MDGPFGISGLSQSPIRPTCVAGDSRRLHLGISEDAFDRVLRRLEADLLAAGEPSG
jgi:hypothetical protein